MTYPNRAKMIVLECGCIDTDWFTTRKNRKTYLFCDLHNQWSKVIRTANYLDYIRFIQIVDRFDKTGELLYGYKRHVKRKIPENPSF
jgi:hypothetical protein